MVNDISSIITMVFDFINTHIVYVISNILIAMGLIHTSVR